jgi:hypothetical protein
MLGRLYPGSLSYTVSQIRGRQPDSFVGNESKQDKEASSLLPKSTRLLINESEWIEYDLQLVCAQEQKCVG